MKIITLNEEQMRRIFTMSDAIVASENALKAYSSGKSHVPLRINIDVPKHEGQSLYMPGYVEDAAALGVKIVSVYPKNIERGLHSVPATMVLLDNQTGQVCSLMDGTFLTKIRTGAVSGAATALLARKNASVLALFGTGGQAESQLEAVLAVRQIKNVKVFDVNTVRAEEFAQRMTDLLGDKFDIKITAAKTSEDAIRDADIITTVTTAKNPVFNGRFVKKGVHINSIGSYTPEMQEIDEYIVCNAQKVYVDTRNGALNESGNLIIPISKGMYSADRVTGEIGEVILGQVPGRESDDELTYFESVGSGVLDVVTARRIYEKALEKGIGHETWL